MNRIRKSPGKTPLVFVLLLSFINAGFSSTAGAEIIGTKILIEQQRDVRLNRIEAFLAREEVRNQLIGLGVDPLQAEDRVQALTDSELAMLGERLDNLPAGAGAIEIIGVVFLVLLILELVGVTNIFTKL